MIYTLKIKLGESLVTFKTCQSPIVLFLLNLMYWLKGRVFIVTSWQRIKELVVNNSAESLKHVNKSAQRFNENLQNELPKYLRSVKRLLLLLDQSCYEISFILKVRRGTCSSFDILSSKHSNSLNKRTGGSKPNSHIITFSIANLSTVS